MDIQDINSAKDEAEKGQSSWSNFSLEDIKMLKDFLKTLKEFGGGEKGLTTDDSNNYELGSGYKQFVNGRRHS